MKVFVAFCIDMKTGDYEIEFQSNNKKPIDYYSVKLVLERAIQDFSQQVQLPIELQDLNVPEKDKFH